MEGKELQIIDERELLGKHFVIYGTPEEPLFKAKDVAEWIGYYKNPQGYYDVSSMVKTVDEDEKELIQIGTKNNLLSAWFLTEDGLYEVLMQSRKPIAKKFKKEVKKILKQIRQTGGYIPVVPEETNEQLMARAFIVAQNTIAERDRQLAAIQEENRKQQEQLEEQAPKVELADERLALNGCISITDANKTFGLGQGKLMQWARNKGFIDKRNYIKEVNQAGRKYFKVYQTGEYRNIGITEEGMKLIKENKKEINSVKLHRNRK